MFFYDASKRFVLSTADVSARNETYALRRYVNKAALTYLRRKEGKINYHSVFPTHIRIRIHVYKHSNTPNVCK